MPAGDRFVSVSKEAMFKFLESKGFKQSELFRAEVIYEREHHKDPRYKILVYTSISSNSTHARRRGADAIRVVAIFDDGKRSHGIAKTTRVFRTGTVEGVFERMLERMRECYAVCNRAIGFYAEMNRGKLSDRSDNQERG